MWFVLFFLLRFLVLLVFFVFFVLVVFSEDDKRVVGRARRIQRFMSQPFAVASQFTGMEGKYVKLEETVSSFERLTQGEFDQYPEQAFFMCGGADDIVKNAERLAQS